MAARALASGTMTETGRILEWLKPRAYGVARRIPAWDFNRDGFFDFEDFVAQRLSPLPRPCNGRVMAARCFASGSGSLTALRSANADRTTAGCCWC
jgi:hypothetical protein